MTSEQFRVPGVSCQHCVNSVRQEVSALEGVQRVDVDLASKLVTVEHDAQATTAQIVAAINEAGYEEVSAVS